MYNVIKRDGKVVPFNAQKIENAILSAFKDVDGTIDDYAKEKAANIATYIQSVEKDLTVEEIQDLVEKGLMATKRKDVARSYISYRNERTRIRGNTTDKTIDEIVNGTSDYWTNENSNKNAMMASTQRDYMAGAISEDISRRKLLPRDVVEAHDAGIIHFHDIDYFAQHLFNCCLVNLEDMLQNGTCINKTMIEKPHSFSTACNIATQIMAVIASGQYGGQSINVAHLSPFVDVSRQKIRKEVEEEFALFSPLKNAYEKDINAIVEKRLKDEIKRGVQTMQYQINTLNTSNGQTPFVTLFLNLDDVEPGQQRDDLAMVIKEILEQRIEGTKNEAGVYVTPAFPKLVYVLDEMNMPEGSEYRWLTELAAKCSAKRLVPDYVSAKVMRECKKGDVYAPMGCRSFLTPDRWSEQYGNMSNSKTFDKHKGHIYFGRMNQGVVTLNLVDLGLSANKDMDEFWKLFEERTELCHRALRCRHERLLGTKSDISPTHWQFGGLARLKPGETIDKLLYHGYSTISLGYAGLWECVLAMTGKKLTEPEGEAFGLEIMQKLNDKCNQWKAAEDIDYSLYGTPLESSTYKFAKCLRKRFGSIPGITDRDYITNSYHIHVEEQVDPFTKLATEAKFQRLSPGGAISYIETADMSHNTEAVLTVMQFIYDNIMYAELNTKSDYCQKCGYDGEIKLVDEGGKYEWVCPNCGNRDKRYMNVARRTCGYIGSNWWNQGRTAEIHDRYVHLDTHVIDEEKE